MSTPIVQCEPDLDDATLMELVHEVEAQHGLTGGQQNQQPIASSSDARAAAADSNASTTPKGTVAQHPAHPAESDASGPSTPENPFHGFEDFDFDSLADVDIVTPLTRAYPSAGAALDEPARKRVRVVEPTDNTPAAGPAPLCDTPTRPSRAPTSVDMASQTDDKLMEPVRVATALKGVLRRKWRHHKHAYYRGYVLTRCIGWRGMYRRWRRMSS